MMANYVVPANSGIGDAVLNSTGSLDDVNNWDLILTANSFNSWTPTLVPGQALVIPSTVNTDQNNYRALNQYPANNFSVPGIYAQLLAVFEQMNG